MKEEEYRSVNFYLPPSSPLFRYTLNEQVPATNTTNLKSIDSNATDGTNSSFGIGVQQDQVTRGKRQQPDQSSGWKGAATVGSARGTKELNAAYGQIQVLPFPRKHPYD